MAWYNTSWLPWDSRASSLSIAVKELVPIILACAAWGQSWHTCQVWCRCDNQVVVAALRSWSCKDPGVMHLLRCLTYIEAQIGCHLYGVYIHTHNNHLVDYLSHNHVLSFLSKVPSADSQPTPTSPDLLSLLLNPQADWILQQWRQRFSAIFIKGLALSTHKTYGAAMKQFFTFCTHFNILCPFPVTEHLLCCFAAFLVDRGLAPQTVKGYLAAVRNMQVSLGLPDPSDQSSLPMLKRVQAGIQRIRSMAGPSRTRLPITASVLERIRGQLESSNHHHEELLRAVACTAFFGFFRLGELCPATVSKVHPAASIMWGDVTVDSRENPTMVMKHFKCDQFGVGANIILGRTGQSLCLVTAIVIIRGSGPGVFFQRLQAQVVTKAWFIDQLRSILSAVGVPQHLYAGHSFRIGEATTAAMAGVEDSTIQTLGRWQSAAYLQYVRMPSEQLARLSLVLARNAT